MGDDQKGGITITLTDGDSASPIVGLLEGYTVRMPAASEYVSTTHVVIAGTTNAGVNVYEADDNGAPIVHASWLIPWEDLDRDGRIEVV